MIIIRLDITTDFNSAVYNRDSLTAKVEMRITREEAQFLMEAFNRQYGWTYAPGYSKPGARESIVERPLLGFPSAEKR